jgi:uncharacterized zinc-type alcohol dehydrogenase-like protein
MTTVKAYAALDAGHPLQPFSYELGGIGRREVDIEIMAAGICHSDLSMINNEWGTSQYPLVAGHENIGRVTAIGDDVRNVSVGDIVGVGWTAESCTICQSCLSGSQHHCAAQAGTIIGRHGGFADKIRVQDIWAIKLPKGLDPKNAGPLFCGGVTVFTPFMEFDIRPTHRVGVVGIGGLGHMALKFAAAWGCEVTAFTSSLDKTEALKDMGAHRVVNSRDQEALKAERGRFDMVLSTVNVSLPWHRYIAALAPKGRLVMVGAAIEPVPVAAFSLIGGQKSLSGSQVGSPAMIATMLDFCARHNITPQVEYFPMSKVNEALTHLESGKARYRIVLTRD